ncbi:DUF4233 domain-containing protein [Serinicoccus kebangsaanensis]|uniref:DUF4233 domain-containing protein n=1 Tax=Serinicoccus kebangsaanensis TaxID=2602069 RepID=UPI00178C1DD6|nr:DUF4233 domain-containing protein [Serinicoccus kebangsaanensis]
MTPGTLTRRLCATTLLAQAMSVFFGTLVAWRLGQTNDDPRAGAYLWGGVVLTAVCVVAAGALRGRLGILLGWLAQLLTLAAGVVLPAMLVVAALFGFLWWLCLTQGMRMDRLTAERAAAADVEGD